MIAKITVDRDVFPDLEFEIDAKVSPVIRGNYTGLPEDCYPDEGGEIEEQEDDFEEVLKDWLLKAERELRLWHKNADFTEQILEQYEEPDYDD